MLHDALRLTGRKQRWKNMWKLSVYNASVVWKGEKKMFTLSKCFESNFGTECTICKTRILDVVRQRVKVGGERLQMTESNLRLCCGMCNIFLKLFSFLFGSVMLWQTQASSPRCTDSSWPWARRLSSISTVWPSSFQQLARVSDKS